MATEQEVVSPPAQGEQVDFEEKTLLRWESAERLYKTRGKEFYSTMVVLAVLISIIMFFIEGIMPVLVIWAIVFVAWAMSKTVPVKAGHEITSLGIRTGGGLYTFPEMLFFWVEEKWGEKVLKVAIARVFPNQLSLIINAVDDLPIRKILTGNGVVFRKPEPNLLDKITRFLGEKIPLE